MILEDRRISGLKVPAEEWNEVHEMQREREGEEKSTEIKIWYKEPHRKVALIISCTSVRNLYKDVTE